MHVKHDLQTCHSALVDAREAARKVIKWAEDQDMDTGPMDGAEGAIEEALLLVDDALEEFS